MLSYFTTTATTVATEGTISITTAILTIIISLVVGFLVSVTYMKTAENGSYTQNFAITLIILPVIIALIILLIGSNVARAFSLAGAFSIVRFRSAPGNPKDITYVFFSMAAGLACGVGFFAYAVMFTIILCFVMYILSVFNFGAKKTCEKTLKILIPENLDYEGIFDEILAKYTNNYTLRKVKTVDMGSLFELDYQITTDNSLDQKKFLDEIRCRNGNLTVTLVLGQEKSEF